MLYSFLRLCKKRNRRWGPLVRTTLPGYLRTRIVIWRFNAFLTCRLEVEMDEFWVGVVRIACVQPLRSLSLWSGCIHGYRAFLPCRRAQTLFRVWWVATGDKIFVLKKFLHFFKRQLCLLRFFMHTKRHLKLVELFFCRCQVKGSKGIRLFNFFLLSFSRPHLHQETNRGNTKHLSPTIF